MKKTKIERVETILWDRWLLMKIHCEDGTVGIGEGGVHGWQRPTKTMLGGYVAVSDWERSVAHRTPLPVAVSLIAFYGFGHSRCAFSH